MSGTHASPVPGQTVRSGRLMRGEKDLLIFAPSTWSKSVRNLHMLCVCQLKGVVVLMASFDCVVGPDWFGAVMLPDINILLLGPFSLPSQLLFFPFTILSPFPGSAGRHCYLPNIVWQRCGIFYWLKIKVAKSPPRSPPLLLAALKNRGKHQFLSHQWRLHNQLKKTLVWGCKSYLCLISAFRRCMSGFNVTK